MKYSKRSFIKEAVTELQLIATSLTEVTTVSPTYVDVEVLLSNPVHNNEGIALDLSFENEKEKGETLKSLNTLINDITELRQQLLNHKFKEDAKVELEGES